VFAAHNYKLSYNGGMETAPVSAPTAELFYDGDCAFCTACARFIGRFDKHKRITLRPLQGSQHDSGNGCYESILYIDGQKQSQFSTAVVDVLKKMGGMWWLLGILVWLIPRPLRDAAYRFVGRRRHWFGGKRDVC